MEKTKNRIIFIVVLILLLLFSAIFIFNKFTGLNNDDIKNDSVPVKDTSGELNVPVKITLDSTVKPFPSVLSNQLKAKLCDGDYNLAYNIANMENNSLKDEILASISSCILWKEQADSLFLQKKFREAFSKYQNILKINNCDKKSLDRVSECNMTFTENMVYIKGGSFMMGNPDSTKPFTQDERPVRQVTVSGFYISKYEVTNLQYARFLNSYGYVDQVKKGPNAGQEMLDEHPTAIKKTDKGWIASEGYENYPVQNVSWYGAYEFCKYYGLRLPTEAEWEFAARGGIKNLDVLYSGSNSFDDVSWNLNNSGKTTHAVGTKKPNTLGLFDMSGNVYEWCNDWYGNYSTAGTNNPKGLNEGSYKTIRGGSWFSEVSNLRVAYRNFVSPFFRYEDIGFRFAK